MNTNTMYLTNQRKRPIDPALQAALNSSEYLRDLRALRDGRGVGALKDAAATGNIFLRSELNKADTRLHMPLEGHTWFRDVPLMNGGGWVDTETAEFVDVFSPNTDGTGGASNDIGIVNFNRSQDVYPTFAWQRSIRIPLVDSLRLAQANKSPNDILDKAVRTDWNKTLDRRVYTGRNGTLGLVNQTIVTAQAAANGATSGTPSWNTKTPIDIFNDFQNAAEIAWAASGYALDSVPDRFLVPGSAWPKLLQPMVLNIPGTNVTAPYANVLEYIKGNYFGLSINGKTPEIVPVPSWLETAGSGNTRRLVSYVFSDEYLNFGILQDIQRMGGPLSLQDGAFVATYIANTGIVRVFRPTTMLYQDGI
jgi:hypothetical protein